MSGLGYFIYGKMRKIFGYFTLTFKTFYTDFRTVFVRSFSYETPPLS